MTSKVNSDCTDANHQRRPGTSKTCVLPLLAALATLSYTGMALGQEAFGHNSQAHSGIEADVTTDTGAQGKSVVYQIFTRLYGNKNETNLPWGTIADNGVGKFNDIDDKALESIRRLGVTHIWYTGVPHHALIGDYRAIGVSDDDPDVVKGRAGSPYAVKDYYNVNPDLAVDPQRRLQEFEALIDRTHRHGMKVIMDIVPNHVARHYQSLSKPAGVRDFGEGDDTSLEYSRHNNFYYVPNAAFEVPELGNKELGNNDPGNNEPGKNEQGEAPLPLGGEPHPLSDGKFNEVPAKWTGNGSRLPKPDANDWYETVKINYGVRPDGSQDFPALPQALRGASPAEHHKFWQTQAPQAIPSSWRKFDEITAYWQAKGVDGFRFDMAEMVPVPFWSYLNSQIKQRNPEAFLLAEVYNPDLYRDYIQLGLMDYLYDKVGLYDTLREVMAGQVGTDKIDEAQSRVLDINSHMLHFLENHDEQRIASHAFVGDPVRALPAMTVSALIGSSPTLIYFGQENGEAAEEMAGFGQPSRTSIFDYVGVPAHQRWMNGGKFDGGQSSPKEKALRAYYQRLLNLSATAPALKGNYQALTSVSLYDSSPAPQKVQKVQKEQKVQKVFAFSRYNARQQLVIVSNFDSKETAKTRISLPEALITRWGLTDGSYALTELLNGTREEVRLEVTAGTGYLDLSLPPLASLVLALGAAGD